MFLNRPAYRLGLTSMFLTHMHKQIREAGTCFSGYPPLPSFFSRRLRLGMRQMYSPPFSLFSVEMIAASAQMANNV